MLSTKLHHFAIVAFARNTVPLRSSWALWVSPVETSASNYLRMGLPRRWKAGCVKDGHEPFDSCTNVLLSSPAPIRRL